MKEFTDAARARKLSFETAVWLTAAFVTLMPSGAIAQAVEVASVAKVRSIEWLWSSYVSMDFSPDGAHFILGEQLPDSHNHLCVYDTGSLEKIKCVVKLSESKNSYLGELNWPDERLFVTVGGFDESFVGWLDTGGWQEAKFRELDAGPALQFVKGKEGSCPAWDRKQEGLYFGSAAPGGIGRIFFEKGGIKTTAFERGDCAIPGDRFVWFTQNTERGVSLSRQDRATKKIEVILDGNRLSAPEFSVSRQGYLLFVGSNLSSYAALYVFSDALGIQGPFFGPAKEGLIESVRISAAGDRALVSVYDEKHSQAGKNLHHIYMLRLHWK